MSWYLILLRLLHVVAGTFWVGMMAFTVLFLTPALREAGPPGQPVMAALQRRHLMVVLPAIALLTIVSGLLLMLRLYPNLGAFVASRMGLVILHGAGASVIAFLIGIGIMRPAMMQAARLGATMASLSTEAERAAAMSRMQTLRTRGARAGQVILALLLLAASAMAVARYL